MFNGVDVNFNVRLRNSLTFSGGTSTGKVENDWCDIRAAVPEFGATMLNPYCHTESPFQTSFRGLASYTIPRIDVLVSTVFQDKINVGTDQITSLAANYVFTAADQAAAAAQIGRPLTVGGLLQANLIAPGEVYGDRVRQLDIVGQEDHPLRWSAADGWPGHVEPAEQQRDARVQPGVLADHDWLADADDVHEPARLPPERRVRLVTIE